MKITINKFNLIKIRILNLLQEKSRKFNFMVTLYKLKEKFVKFRFNYLFKGKLKDKLCMKNSLYKFQFKSKYKKSFKCQFSYKKNSILKFQYK